MAAVQEVEEEGVDQNEVRNRKALLSIAEHEAGVFLSLGKTRKNSESTMHPYVQLVMNDDSALVGSLDEAYAQLAPSSSTSSLTSMPLEKKRLAMSVSLVFTKVVANAARESPPVLCSRSLLADSLLKASTSGNDAGARPPPLSKYYESRRHRSLVKESAELIAAGLLKAAFKRSVKRRCAAARHVDEESTKRHTIWMKGEQYNTMEGQIKAKEREIRFSSSGAMNEKERERLAKIKTEIEAERKIMEECREKHLKSSRDVVEAEEEMHQLPHTANAGFLCLSYAYVSGSVLGSGSPLPTVWELGYEISERFDKTLLSIMDRLNADFKSENDDNFFDKVPQEDAEELATSWFIKWRNAGGKSILAAVTSKLSPDASSLRDTYLKKFERLAAAYATLSAAEGAGYKEAKRQIDAAAEELMQNIGMEENSLTDAVSSLSLPKTMYLEQLNNLQSGGKWVRGQEVQASAFKLASMRYTRVRADYASRLHAIIVKALGNMTSTKPSPSKTRLPVDNATENSIKAPLEASVKKAAVVETNSATKSACERVGKKRATTSVTNTHAEPNSVEGIDSKRAKTSSLGKSRKGGGQAATDVATHCSVKKTTNASMATKQPEKSAEKEKGEIEDELDDELAELDDLFS